MEGTGVATQELRARAYHINQEACDICNGRGMEPSACIVAMDGELLRRPGEMEKLVLGAVRQVTQEEGVVLHEKQKGFFKELAVGMVRYLKGDV